MKVYVDRLIEEFANQYLRNTDYRKHVLPKTDKSVTDDFINQEYDLGKVNRPLYPMFPYMTETEYENAADNLRLSNADGFINYNVDIRRKDQIKNSRPRAVKYRKMNLPSTPHDNEFYEMVVYSLSDDTVIGYYLCTARRIEREKRTAVYDLHGRPYGDNLELRKLLHADQRAWNEVCNYFDKQEEQDEKDERLRESYSHNKTLTNRFGSVIGFIKSDPATGDAMLLNRFGSVRGYYRARTDTTTDRLGRMYGRGNQLMLLLNDKTLESIEEDMSDNNIDEFRLRKIILSTLEYLNDYDFSFPAKRYLADGWDDWADEYYYDDKNLGELLEDAYALIEYLAPLTKATDDDISVDDVQYYYDKLKEHSHYGREITERASTGKVKSAIFGDNRGLIKTFAVLTAENPMGKKLSDEQNRQRNKLLRKEIAAKRDAGQRASGLSKEAYFRKLHIQYIPIRGRFEGNQENSYIVLNLTLSDTKYLSDKFGQKSFFFGTHNDDGTIDVSYYERKNEDDDYTLIETTRRVDDMADADDFFSKYNGLKWSFYLKYFNESYIPRKIIDMDAFEDSFDESLTNRGRALRRINSYKPYPQTESQMTNVDGLRVLTEANLQRISKGHEKGGYAIISASRGHRTQQENDRQTNILRDKLRNKHYSYIMVYGGYKEEGQDRASMEKSFVVFPYDIQSKKPADFDKFKKDMIDFATPAKSGSKEEKDRENQDAILICEPNGKPYYVNLKGRDDDAPFDDVEYNNTGNEYFTAIKKWNDMSLNRKNRDWKNGKPQRYSFKYNECYIENPPSSMQIGHQRWASGDMNHIYKEL